MLVIAHISAKHSVPVLVETIAANILTVMVVMFVTFHVSRYESEHAPTEIVPAVFI